MQHLLSRRRSRRIFPKGEMPQKQRAVFLTAQRWWPLFQRIALLIISLGLAAAIFWWLAQSAGPLLSTGKSRRFPASPVVSGQTTISLPFTRSLWAPGAPPPIQFYRKERRTHQCR